MAINRTQKEKVVSDVSEILDSAKSVVFVKFHGLPVSESTSMRRDLRKAGVDYRVAKKTLTNIVFKNSSITGDMPVLEGELAIAYSDDEVAAAREIYSFQKKFDGSIEIQGGVFQNELYSREKMVEIAQIPGERTLRGMFLNVINSPIQGLAIALDQIAQKKA